MVEEFEEMAYRPALIKCDSCGVEAIRDVWIKWGLTCRECGAKKVV